MFNVSRLKTPFLLKPPTAHRQGASSASLEDSQKGESLLIENILLPTARLSKDLLESDVVVDSQTRTPEEAHSQEEAVLLAYVENRKKHHALSVLDGANIGILTGVGAGLASIPIAVGLKKTGVLDNFPHALEKGNFLQFVTQRLLFQGFEEITKADNDTLEKKLLAIRPSVFKTIGFGMLSGVFLSMYLTKHQVKSAKHIANEWHKNSEKAQDASKEKGIDAKTSDQDEDSPDHSLEKTLTYPEWKHFAENWKHHVAEAFKFNFIISTAMLGLQVAGLGMGLWLAKREGLKVKDLLEALVKRVEDLEFPLSFVKNLMGGFFNWIKEKSELDDDKIHKSIQKDFPTLALGWLTGRFSVLNVVRLSMLSILTAKFWADKNIKSIKELETNVSPTQDDKPKTSPKVNETT